LNILKKLSGSGPFVNFRESAKKGTVIVDVRTVAEFESGYIKDAVKMLNSNLVVNYHF